MGFLYYQIILHLMLLLPTASCFLNFKEIIFPVKQRGSSLSSSMTQDGNLLKVEYSILILPAQIQTEVLILVEHPSFEGSFHFQLKVHFLLCEQV